MKQYFLIILIIAGILLTGCSAAKTEPAPVKVVPPATVVENIQPTVSVGTVDGKTILNTTCTACHSVKKATEFHGDEKSWTRTIDDMIQRGAKLTTEERDILITYMAENYK